MYMVVIIYFIGTQYTFGTTKT